MPKTIVITGANRGIGLELAQQLAARGEHVIATCRESSPELNKLDVEIFEQVDVSSLDQMQKFAAKIQSHSVDWLINNAGLLQSVSLDSLDLESIARCNRMFEINSMGPLITTYALLNNLSAGSKIGIISSRMGSVADNDSGGSYGYRMSKSAAIAAGKSLAIDLESRNIAVAILHPGWVRTQMTGFSGLIDPDESARKLIERMEALTLATSGTFWHVNGEKLPF